MNPAVSENAASFPKPFPAVAQYSSHKSLPMPFSIRQSYLRVKIKVSQIVVAIYSVRDDKKSNEKKKTQNATYTEHALT